MRKSTESLIWIKGVPMTGQCIAIAYVKVLRPINEIFIRWGRFNKVVQVNAIKIFLL